MEQFLQIVLAFPTVVFSVLLLVALGYWLIALLGLVDLDVLDVASADGVDLDVTQLSGLLMKLGFDGLPITLIFTGIALFAWVLSYAGTLVLAAFVPGALHWAFAIALALLAFMIAIPFAGLALRPLRGLFMRHEAPAADDLLARTAIVRSPVVNESQGTATLEDGGAGLILQVRAASGQFRRGDSVVLVEYVPASNAYRVIAASAAGDAVE